MIIARRWPRLASPVNSRTGGQRHTLKTDMTWEQMERAIEFLTNQSAEQSTKISQLIQVTNQDADNIRRLANVAEAHERG
jgi:hypothetical protein